MYHESNEPVTQRGHNRYFTDLREICRVNRKKPTPAEALLWNVVLSKRILGYKFLRQKPLDQFILDFYCSKLLLAVEIDGGYHLGQKKLDHERDIKLSMIGIKTIRYTNDEVLKTLNLVRENLKQEILERSYEI